MIFCEVEMLYLKLLNSTVDVQLNTGPAGIEPSPMIEYTFAYSQIMNEEFDNKTQDVTDSIKPWSDVVNRLHKIPFHKLFKQTTTVGMYVTKTGSDEPIGSDQYVHTTNAYWKMVELLLWMYKDSTISSHMDIAGAPGMFTLAVRDYFKKELTWFASSLEDKDALTDTYGIYKSNPKLFYPADLTKQKDVDGLVKFVDQKFDLVTGDVGCEHDYDKYDLQEYSSLDVQWGQTAAALRLVKEGGNVVLKVFTLITKQSAYMLDVLASQFKEVYIVKPYTSRITNKESYIVGLGYNGNLVLPSLRSDPPIQHIYQNYMELADYEVIRSLHVRHVLNSMDKPNFRIYRKTVVDKLLGCLIKVERLVIYTDGSAINNSQEAQAGWAFYIPSLNILESGKFVGSNNKAELLAILNALKRLKTIKPCEVIVKSDSMYAINALSSSNKAKANVEIIDQCLELLNTLKHSIIFTHVYAHRSLSSAKDDSDREDIKNNDVVDKAAREQATR